MEQLFRQASPCGQFANLPGKVQRAHHGRAVAGELGKEADAAQIVQGRVFVKVRLQGDRVGVLPAAMKLHDGGKDAA